MVSLLFYCYSLLELPWNSVVFSFENEGHEALTLLCGERSTLPLLDEVDQRKKCGLWVRVNLSFPGNLQEPLWGDQWARTWMSPGTRGATTGLMAVLFTDQDLIVWQKYGQWLGRLLSVFMLATAIWTSGGSPNQTLLWNEVLISPANLESEKFISSCQDKPRNKNLGWDHLDLLFLAGPQEHRGLGANGSECLRLESLFPTRLVALLVWYQLSSWYLPSTFLRISWDFLDFFDSVLSSPLLWWIFCFFCHLGRERVSP